MRLRVLQPHKPLLLFPGEQAICQQLPSRFPGGGGELPNRYPGERKELPSSFPGGRDVPDLSLGSGSILSTKKGGSGHKGGNIKLVQGWLYNLHSHLGTNRRCHFVTSFPPPFPKRWEINEHQLQQCYRLKTATRQEMQPKPTNSRNA